jgi:hypothetical protein
MKFTLTSCCLVVVLNTAPTCAQDARVSLHVTSVRQGDANDYCTTGRCSATRFTVEGYTQDEDGGTQYVLECVEVIASEPGQHSVTCFRAHARAKYIVRIFAQSVAFGHDQSAQNVPIEVDYNIKSEKEVRKK